VPMPEPEPVPDSGPDCLWEPHVQNDGHGHGHGHGHDSEPAPEPACRSEPDPEPEPDSDLGGLPERQAIIRAWARARARARFLAPHEQEGEPVPNSKLKTKN
jgi:hypothetical protein